MLLPVSPLSTSALERAGAWAQPCSPTQTLQPGFSRRGVSPSTCSPHSGPQGTEKAWYLFLLSIQCWRDMDKNWHYLGQPRLTNFENISKDCTEVSPVLVPLHPSATPEQQHPRIVPWKHHLVFNICHGGSHPLGWFSMHSEKPSFRDNSR